MRFITSSQSACHNFRTIVFAAYAIFCIGVYAQAEDWQQWMGPNRDGVYRESGIIDSIPDSGLRIKWRTPVQGGYAGPAVADGKVFVFDYQRKSGKAFNNPSQRANLNGSERVIALDAKTGEEIWLHQYDCPYSISYPAGPRCTPTVDGERIYILGSEGDFKCLNSSDGTVVWETNFKKEFSAEVPIWGFSAHPLVDGDLVYTMVGGQGQGIVAFDKMTGKVKWKALDCKAGYCPPTIIEKAGTRQLIVYHPTAVASLNPQSGKSYWSIEIEPLYEMAICRPMINGNYLYASGIGNKSVMI
ncbi:MAG: PQQ-binding-like beta-propeller repeat protein, partial [Planctomycetota bacterium]